MNIYVNTMKKWKQKWKRLKISKQADGRNKCNKPLEQGRNLNIHHTTDGESNYGSKRQIYRRNATL
jgi:hypothetical protein